MSRFTPAKSLVTSGENISGKITEIKLDSHKAILKAGRKKKRQTITQKQTTKRIHM